MVLKEGYVRYNVIIKSFILISGLGIAVSSATGCATKEIDYKASDKLQKNQEFEKMVTIKEIDPPAPVEEAPATEIKTETVVDERR